jgi:3-deoxy-7-phosphoheptulonate synthase
MHGNTRKADGQKFRLLPDLRAEITAFVRVLRQAGHHPAGLHLEVSPDAAGECHEDVPGGHGPTSNPPCDPRLDPAQALQIVDHFADEVVR